MASANRFWSKSCLAWMINGPDGAAFGGGACGGMAAIDDSGPPAVVALPRTLDTSACMPTAS